MPDMNGILHSKYLPVVMQDWSSGNDFPWGCWAIDRCQGDTPCQIISVATEEGVHSLSSIGTCLRTVEPFRALSGCKQNWNITAP